MKITIKSNVAAILYVPMRPGHKRLKLKNKGSGKVVLSNSPLITDELKPYNDPDVDKWRTIATILYGNLHTISLIDAPNNADEFSKTFNLIAHYCDLAHELVRNGEMGLEFKTIDFD